MASARTLATIFIICASVLIFSAAPAAAGRIATCAPAADSYAKAVLANQPVAYYRLDDASGLGDLRLADRAAGGRA